MSVDDFEEFVEGLIYGFLSFITSFALLALIMFLASCGSKARFQAASSQKQVRPDLVYYQCHDPANPNDQFIYHREKL